jgi:hypothetical protein
MGGGNMVVPGPSHFATTLPELFAAMCSNQENNGERAGV